MNDRHPTLAPHEPSLHTVEMVCDRLAELGVAVGPETARELVQAVLTAEAPRVDARLREALDTALETIRVAAQAAMGVLATTSPSVIRRDRPEPPAPPQGRRPEPYRPEPPRPEPPRPAPSRPEPSRAEPHDDFDDDDRRPVFRRPRGR